jgi:hypothetical protein
MILGRKCIMIVVKLSSTTASRSSLRRLYCSLENIRMDADDRCSLGGAGLCICHYGLESLEDNKGSQAEKMKERPFVCFETLGSSHSAGFDPSIRDLGTY